MAVMPKYYKIHTDGCTVELEPIYEELVSVVRYKDCINCDAHLKKNGEVYFYKCDFFDIEIEADDFCSYGERKDT